MRRRLALASTLLVAGVLPGCAALDGCGEDFESSQPLVPGREKPERVSDASRERSAQSAVDRPARAMQQRAQDAPATEARERIEGVAPIVERRTTAAARRFLAGYLPYSYGRERAESVEAAAPALRRRLAAQPPRVPPAVRRLQPRLERVAVSGADGGRAFVLAQVHDGRERYALTLRLAGPSRPVVEEVR